MSGMFRWIVPFVIAVAAAPAADIRLDAGAGSPPVEFALSRLRPVVQSQEGRIDVALDAALGAEAFRTRRTAAALEIRGGDERGLMYGILDVAEQARLRGGLANVPQRTVRPRFSFRTIKFNLPWMSYRKGEALQVHMETCRDLEFWRGYLDMMAENRFNTLTLWNLHPFTFLIRPRNFPEASPFSDAELADWQRFWHSLFRMAKDRGIEVYLVNWNVFVSSEFARAHKVAPYSETWSIGGPGDKSELVERYMRECVTQVIDEYPELAGLGITLGERMAGFTSAERRAWIDNTIIAGMKAAKRRAKLIYRAPLTADTGASGSTSVETERVTRDALEKIDSSAATWVEFKYNWSHGHSSNRLHIVHGGKLTDTYWNPAPANYRVVWTMRNEDFFVLRWGDPNYIRDTIANNGEDWVGGFIIGSECYIPAKDYIHGDGPHRTWKYAWERQWLFYKLWGRLLYDPATPDEVFEAELAHRYGVGRGAGLLNAYRLASRVPLRIASFTRGTWDGDLYSEGFVTQKAERKVTFLDIDYMINREVLDPRYISIAEFVKNGGKAEGRISPLDLAGTLDRDAAEAQRIVTAVRAQSGVSPTLECELADIEAWNALGRYVAAKLRGGVALATFRAGGDAAQQKRAVTELETAAGYWKQLASTIESHDRPVIPYIFDPKFSWSKWLPDVQKDIETARAARR